MAHRNVKRTNAEETVAVLCGCGWGNLKLPVSEVPDECPLCGMPFDREVYVDEETLENPGEFFQGPGDDLYYRDAEFVPFASWQELLDAVAARPVVWYQAPLEWRPNSVEARVAPYVHQMQRRRRRSDDDSDAGDDQRSITIPPGQVLLIPAPSRGDPFLRGPESLKQFFRRVEAQGRRQNPRVSRLSGSGSALDHETFQTRGRGSFRVEPLDGYRAVSITPYERGLPQDEIRATRIDVRDERDLAGNPQPRRPGWGRKKGFRGPDAPRMLSFREARARAIAIVEATRGNITGAEDKIVIRDGSGGFVVRSAGSFPWSDVNAGVVRLPGGESSKVYVFVDKDGVVTDGPWRSLDALWAAAGAERTASEKRKNRPAGRKRTRRNANVLTVEVSIGTDSIDEAALSDPDVTDDQIDVALAGFDPARTFEVRGDVEEILKRAGITSSGRSDQRDDLMVFSYEIPPTHDPQIVAKAIKRFFKSAPDVKVSLQ